MTLRPFRLFCLALALCYGLCCCGGAFETLDGAAGAGEGGRAVAALGPQVPDAHISPDDPSLCSLGPLPSSKTAASWGCLFPLPPFLLRPPRAASPGGLSRRKPLPRRTGFRGLLPLPAAPPRA